MTEYLKAGLIPVVPDEGGSSEVVAARELTYATNDDAAHILAHLVTDDGFRAAMQRHCAQRATDFSRDAYLARQHDLLQRILAQ